MISGVHIVNDVARRLHMAFLELFRTPPEDILAANPVWGDDEVPHFYRLYALFVGLEKSYVIKSNTESCADEVNADVTDDGSHVDEFRLSNGNNYCFCPNSLLIHLNSAG